MKPELRRIRERVRLNRLAINGAAAQALFAANELGLFDVLERRGSSTADEVARELDTDPDATERLLGTLVALDVVEHEEGRFANTAAASEFLVTGVPESMASWVSLVGIWNRKLTDLAASVQSGQPVQDPTEHLGGSPAYTRTFTLGMHDYAIGPGSELARHLDLSGCSRLLDVGGGPGTYSMLLAEANPDLRCTVFDLPAVVAIAQELVAERGLADRVDTVAGDYHHDAFPAGFDAVLVSNTLHQEDWETCVEILRQSHAALDAGGLVVVHAMFMNERRDGPLWPTVHNLVLQVVYAGGRSYNVPDTYAMLEEAGFGDFAWHTMSPFNAGSFVTARRR